MNNDTPQDLSQEVQRLQAKADQLVDRLLTDQQKVARDRRTIELLRALPPEMHARVGASLVKDLLQAERDRAADQAVREFPDFLQGVLRRARQRQSQ